MNVYSYESVDADGKSGMVHYLVSDDVVVNEETDAADTAISTTWQYDDGTVATFHA